MQHVWDINTKACVALFPFDVMMLYKMALILHVIYIYIKESKIFVKLNFNKRKYETSKLLKWKFDRNGRLSYLKDKGKKIFYRKLFFLNFPQYILKID